MTLFSREYKTLPLVSAVKPEVLITYNFGLSVCITTHRRTLQDEANYGELCILKLLMRLVEKVIQTIRLEITY